jgi:hypothetical protein
MKRKVSWLIVEVISLLVFAQSSFAALAFKDFDPKLPTGIFRVGDFDADGSLDVILFVQGQTNAVQLFRNTNGVAFARMPLPDTSSANSYTSILLADDNGDGLLDFAMTRTNSAGEAVVRIFIQNADHTFNEKETGLKGVAALWRDLDNDGRLDFVVNPAVAGPASNIYWKESDGTYSGTPLPGGHYLSSANDVDNDGDVDLLLVDNNAIRWNPYENGSSVHRIFRNDGGRHFADTGVVGAFDYAADFDGDGRLDFLGMVRTNAPNPPFATILENTIVHNAGGLNFSETGYGGSTIYVVQSVADYDSDGAPDWLSFTTSNASGFAPALTLNTNGNFLHADATFAATANDVAMAVAADFDNDGDLDFMVYPRNSSPPRLLQSNLNRTHFVASPSNLVSRVRRDRVDLSWDGATAVTYNVRVGTTPGGSEALASASLANGKRLLAEIGNVGVDHAWHLDRLAPGTYYWSVQAVDYGFRGSEFAQEMTFTVADPGPLPPAPTIESVENLVTDEDTAIEIPVAIGPVDAADDLVLTAETDNSKLIVAPGVTFTGSGANRRMRILPAHDENGVARMTLRATDPFGQSSTTSFYLTVFPVNDPPAFSEIPNQVAYAGAPRLTVPFTVTDLETIFTARGAGFAVTATSSDTNLLPNSALQVTPPPDFPLSSPDPRSLLVTIPANKSGSTTITLSTTDGAAQATRSFVLEIQKPLFKDSGTLLLPTYTTSPWYAGDFDNDGRMDLIVGALGTWVYLNTPSGFVQLTNDFVNNGMMAVADFNHDNYLDVLSVAPDNVYLYLNQHGTNFTTTILPSFTRFESGHIEIADVNNDGNPDAVIIGMPAGGSVPVTRLFLGNNGKFTFATVPFPGIFGNFALVDMDHDGWVDCVFAGTTSSGAVTNGIMRNVGGSRFVFQPGSNLIVPTSFNRIGDLDSDGVLDLWDGSTFYKFLNGAFRSVSTNSSPQGLPYLTASADLDNDGQLDLIYTSQYFSSPFPPTFAVLHNEGDFHFRSLGNPLYALGLGGRLIVDMNGDGAPDIVGQPTNNLGLIILTNTFAALNAQPGVPQNLRAERIGDAIRFSWDAPTDLDQAAGLTYNVRIGSTPGGVDVVSPLSLANGKRLTQALGNAANGTSFVLTNLTKAKYYWTVQAIDGAQAAGTFAPEQSIGYNLPGNVAPTVTFTPNEYIGSENVTGTITLTVADDTTSAADVRLRVFAVDPELIAFTNITVTGIGATRTVKFKPSTNQFGITQLIVQAFDASNTASTNSMNITILPPPENGGQFAATTTATGVQITLAAEVGRQYIIETSTDLLGWNPFGVYSSASGQIVIDAPFNDSDPTRFYRARVK